MANVRLDWSERDAELHAHAVAARGWLRMRPLTLPLLLVGAGLNELAPTREYLAEYANGSTKSGLGLQESCWPAADEADPVEASRQRSQAAHYSAFYGLEMPEVVDDLITLTVAAGVLVEVDDGSGTLRIRPARPLPSPADVFPVGREESMVLDLVAADARYAAKKLQVLSLFSPGEHRHQEITTSLERLARVTDGSPHDARQTVLLMLGEGDFTASADISNLAPHKVFRLRCSWTDFDEQRIRIH